MIAPLCTALLLVAACSGQDKSAKPVNIENSAQRERYTRASAQVGQVESLAQNERYTQVEMGERMLVMQRVEDAVRAENYAALDAMEKEFRSSRARTPSGTWKLRWFYEGFVGPMPINAENGCSHKLAAFASDWIKARPKAPAPPIVEAGALVNIGACLRGDEIRRLTAPEAEDAFERYALAAEQVLTQHRAVAEIDPQFFVEMIRAYGAQAKSSEAVWRLMEEGAAREPYYHDIYFSTSQYFLPQWYGSWADLDHLARYAVTRTQEGEGSSLYARIFWGIEQWRDLDFDRIDWAAMRRSMQDIYDRYPSDWNAGSFMRLACQKGDRETAAHYDGLRRYKDTVAWTDRNEAQSCETFAGGQGAEN